MIAFWLTTGILWTLELAGAPRLVTWCLGLAALYLVVMLCVAFVDRPVARPTAEAPPLRPPPQDAAPSGRAKPQTA
jgi:hypothetical protein